MLQCKSKWKKCALDKMAELYQPQTISQDKFTQTGYTVFGANGIIGFYNEYNHELPQVLITCRGNTCGTINISLPKSWITGNAMVVNVDTTKSINKLLLYYLLNFFDFSKIITGTGQPQIVRQSLNKVQLLYPFDEQEQQKIADILSTCDEVIEKTEETIEKYQQIKVGMMQDLFTRGLDSNGKLRPTYVQAPDLYKFSEELDRYIPKDWDVYPVSRYIESLEAGVSVNSNDVSSMSEFAVLKTSCVYDGKFIPNENKTVIEKDLKRVKVNPRKDSLIISRMNTPLLVGEMGYVEQDYDLLFLPDRLWQTVKSNINFINMRFLNYLLNTEKYKKAIKEKATGTSNSMKNITKEDFLNTLLSVPKEEEQNTIVKYLVQIDAKIDFEEQYLNKYKQIKQGLMKRLLTPPADAEIVEE